ncbi:hypothetical protein D1871_05185 [Nakamurella silvestris]|nr:hypothetical protein D1871_05185 [Nakamurella silvestris]
MNDDELDRLITAGNPVPRDRGGFGDRLPDLRPAIVEANSAVGDSSSRATTSAVLATGRAPRRWPVVLAAAAVVGVIAVVTVLTVPGGSPSPALPPKVVATAVATSVVETTGAEAAVPAPSAGATSTVTTINPASRVDRLVDRIPELVGLELEYRTAQATVITSCLAAGGFTTLPAGFDFSADATELAVAQDVPAGGGGAWLPTPWHFPNAATISPTPEFAAAHGYGISDVQSAQPGTVFTAKGKRSVDPFLGTSRSYQERFWAAYDGHDEFGTGTKVPIERTCLGRSRAALPDLSSPPVSPAMLRHLGTPTAEDAQYFSGSPSWASAQAAWISCMSAAGYEGLTDISSAQTVFAVVDPVQAEIPGQPWAPAGSYFDDPEQARRTEIAVAVADAGCARTSGLDAAHQEQLRQWRHQWVTDNLAEMTVYEAWVDMNTAEIRAALARG